MKLKIATLLVLASLVACQTPPDLKKLQAEKASLNNQLQQANAAIKQHNNDKAELKAELVERERVIDVLSGEKQSRVVTSTKLRGQVRHFVQQQVDFLKAFLLEGNLLDYIGGELVQRTAVDEQPLLIVDKANPVPKDGSLTSVGGYFNTPGQLAVKVMRKVEDNLVVVWESGPLTISAAGLQKVGFAVSVGVQRGDYIAYYLVTPAMSVFGRGCEFRSDDSGVFPSR